jgi:hypothetical protein
MFFSGIPGTKRAQILSLAVFVFLFGIQAIFSALQFSNHGIPIPLTGHPVPRLTLLFFNAAKAPEAAETATSRTAYAQLFQLHEQCQSRLPGLRWKA